MSGIVYNGNTGYSFKINGVTPDVYYNGTKIWPASAPAYVGYMVEMKWTNQYDVLPITTGPASTYPTKINSVAITQNDLPQYCCQYYDNNYRSWSTMSYSDYNSLFNNGLSLSTNGIRLYYQNTPGFFIFSWYNTEVRLNNFTVNVYKWTNFNNITLFKTSSYTMDSTQYRYIQV